MGPKIRRSTYNKQLGGKHFIPTCLAWVTLDTEGVPAWIHRKSNFRLHLLLRILA